MSGSLPHQVKQAWPAVARRLIGAVPPSAILLLLTVVVVGIGLLLVQSSFTQRNARALARNEAETMSVLQNLGQALVDAETGQRGYLLTNDPAYLGPFDNSRRQIPEELRALRTQLATADDAQVNAHMTAVETLVSAKLEEMDQTVGYARGGAPEVALQIVRSNTGKATMDQLRRHLTQLSVSQRQRREDAFTAADRAESRQIPLLLGMWATLILLVFAAVRGERRRTETEALAGQAVRLHDLNERNKLLAQELNHRVKNLFGVVLSLVGLAGREKGSAEVIIGELKTRIHALARAHSLAFGTTPDALTELRALLEGVLEPYQDGEADRIVMTGEGCGIAAHQITPLTLVLHELATNAAKYGALSASAGRVTIAWDCRTGADGKVRTRIVWREEGGPPPDPDRIPASGGTSGFGNRMTDAVLRQIDGSIDRQWPQTGAVVNLTFHRDDPHSG